MRKVICAVTALAAAATVTSAMAETGEAERAEDVVTASFIDLDTDESGTLTRAELESFPTMASHFEEADGDGDGALDRDEFTTLLKITKTSHDS